MGERNVPLLGALVAALTFGSAALLRGPRLIDALLVLAPTVIVPLALRIDMGRVSPGLLVSASAAAASLIPDPGTLAGVLSAIWLAYTSLSFADTALPIVRSRRMPSLDTIVAVGARGFLVGAAAWLVISRMGWRPLGIASTIVELTAMHFHYAGFATTVLALRAARQLDGASARTARLAGIALLASSLIVAIGFVGDPVFQMIGAIPVAISVMTIAVMTFVASTDVAAPARILLRVQAVAPFAAMTLALVWAIGNQLSVSPIGIQTMVRTHGVLNAIGFVLCGLVGWTSSERRSATA